MFLGGSSDSIGLYGNPSALLSPKTKTLNAFAFLCMSNSSSLVVELKSPLAKYFLPMSEFVINFPSPILTH